MSGYMSLKSAEKLKDVIPRRLQVWIYPRQSLAAAYGVPPLGSCCVYPWRVSLAS
ncbi:MAG: hypothetical protein KGI38_10785 [Thaumarchaeota archaeon]|nr:hypothetical protein [Nitrososphaerota archaeon]